MFFRLSLLASLLVSASVAQAQTNDGFQRRDGTMYLVRNGEARPMTRDARLPNGRLITRDGFVVTREGQRTELKDGQGCTLLGEAVAVTTQPNGRLLLAGRAGNRTSAATPAGSYQQAVLRWLEGRGKGHGKHKRKHKRHDD